MKNHFGEILKSTSWLFLLLVIVIGCNVDDNMPLTKTSAKLSAKQNADIVTIAQEVYDISGAGLQKQGIPSGRIADGDEGEEGDDDNKLCGAIVTKSFTMNSTLPDSLIFTGSITVDFGDGTACSDSSHRRTGKMTTEFTINVSLKNHHLYNSTETVTFNNFTKDARRLSGTYHFRTLAGGIHFMDVVNSKLEYDSAASENATVTWSGSLTFTRDSNGTITRDDDTKTITGQVSGTTSNGDSFSSNITKAVVIKWMCFKGHNIPVEGTIDITRNGTTTTVDFGDGSCDKLYTSTTAGQTTDLHF